MSDTALEIESRVKKVVCAALDVDEEKVHKNSHFINDIGADSLDNVELVMAFEEEFGVDIPDDMAEDIQTVQDAIAFISKNV